MCARISLQQVRGVTDDLNGRRRASENQVEIQRDRNRRPNLDVALQSLEPLDLHGDVVRVRRQVRKRVPAGGVRGARAAESGNGVTYPNFDGLHDAAGGIFDGPLKGSSPAQALS